MCLVSRGSRDLCDADRLPGRKGKLPPVFTSKQQEDKWKQVPTTLAELIQCWLRQRIQAGKNLGRLIGACQIRIDNTWKHSLQWRGILAGRGHEGTCNTISLLFCIWLSRLQMGPHHTHLLNCWWVSTRPSSRMGNFTSQLPTMFWILKSKNLAGNPSFCTTLAYFLAASLDCSSLEKEK